jgi:GrpB-like predicted nucleotidyltransferase (UPF0157 family)
MKISKVALQELIDCYDDNDFDHEYFLNIETGDIVYDSSYIDVTDTEHLERMEEVEDGFGEIYFRVPKIDSHEGYISMEDFIDNVKVDRIKHELYKAISGNKGVFRRFKDVLSNYPDIQEQYYQFKNERNKEKVLEWLKSENIEFELMDD